MTGKVNGGGLKRTHYVVLLAATIVLGLASRHLPAAWPAWIAKDPGDVLYAAMVYWIVRLAIPRQRALAPAITAIAVCFAIEAFKLWHLDWLDQTRHTVAGRLILGVGFHVSNLACYVIGAGLAVAVEKLATKA
jgi:hypothetical protein